MSSVPALDGIDKPGRTIRLKSRKRTAMAINVPWRVQVGDDVIEQAVVPAICTNDEILELHAVVAGHVIGQLAGVTAAPYIRSGQLVPLLVDHMPERSSYFVYFGSRTSQPARARAFIDLVTRRLVNNTEYVLNSKELRAAQARGRRA